MLVAEDGPSCSLGGGAAGLSCPIWVDRYGVGAGGRATAAPDRRHLLFVGDVVPATAQEISTMLRHDTAGHF